MKRMFWLIFCLLFLPGLVFAQTAQGHQSANNCPEPDGPHFHWRVRGARPVAPPIENARDVARIARTESWHRLATQNWPIKNEDIPRMILQAENGNFVRREFAPCAVLEDMIFGSPPMHYSGKVIYDPNDRMPAYAYVLEIGSGIEFLFFEHCANPAYRRIPPLAAPPPPPPPTYDLLITKRVRNLVTNGPDSISIESTRFGAVQFTVTLKSQGTGDNTNVILSDLMPSGFKFLPGSLRIDGILGDDQKFFGSGISYPVFGPGTSTTAIYEAAINLAANISEVERIEILENNVFARSDQVRGITTRAFVRVILPAQAPPPPRDICVNIQGVQTFVPEGMLRDETTERCEPLPPQAPPPRVTIQTQYQYTACPVVDVDAYTTKTERWLGTFKPRNLWELGVSLIGSAGPAYAFSKPVSIKPRQAFMSAGVSLAGKYILDVVNPDKNKVKVNIGGKETGRFGKGQDSAFKDVQGRVIWKGDKASVYLTSGGKDSLCGSGHTVNNNNLVLAPIIERRSERVVNVPGPSQCFVLVNGEVKACWTPEQNTPRPTTVPGGTGATPITGTPNTGRPSN